MELFRLGSQHEFLEIGLPDEIGADGWFTSLVRVGVGEFTGSAEVYLQTRDLEDFHNRLFELHLSLSGVAELNTIERQIVVRLRGNGRGAIDVEVFYGRKQHMGRVWNLNLELTKHSW